MTRIRLPKRPCDLCGNECQSKNSICRACTHAHKPDTYDPDAPLTNGAWVPHKKLPIVVWEAAS